MNSKVKTPYSVYLVPVPIGSGSYAQLNSIFYQSIVTEISFWVCENARTLRRYLSSLNLQIVIDSLEIYELNKHGSNEDLYNFAKKYIEKGNIGFASEAGMPGIADPGNQLCIWAHKTNIQVIPLIGPSSIFMALAASGLNGQKFYFGGYPPIKDTEWPNFAKNSMQGIGYKTTQIFIEAPYRSDRTLQLILKYFPAHYLLCIAKNLHEDDQFISTRLISQWKKNIPILGKNPCVFLLNL